MSLEEGIKLEARREICETLSLCNFYTRKLGMSFIDETRSTLLNKVKNAAAFVAPAMLLLSLLAGEFVYLATLLTKNASVAEFVASLYICGYGLISLGKMVILLYKRHVFEQLVRELQDIWPVRTNDQEAREIKRRSLTALRVTQLWYTILNQSGVILYNLTPLVIHVYRLLRRQPSDLEYVWDVVYPFDKHRPLNHAFVYVYEFMSGQASVMFMLSSDLLFTAMTSHISMLLRLLQLRIRRLAVYSNEHILGGLPGDTYDVDCYEEISACVKVHQRLIKYFDDLESAFSVVNLINVLLSSVNICCVVFVIVLLEPWMHVSNKLFLCAVVTQMGILCWYADDLCTASVEVADAVYESGWYKANSKCRRALLIILQRSQKPLYYTTMKFNTISMRTYASTITTAYSYFALLYTMYSEN